MIAAQTTMRSIPGGIRSDLRENASKTHDSIILDGPDACCRDRMETRLVTQRYGEITPLIVSAAMPFDAGTRVNSTCDAHNLGHRFEIREAARRSLE